ncbi:MAG TPA: DUF1127 domain-containing protein [Acetobacteraceae bacterium]|nr:DUF1127 domain-containing protein [Acetobacteraceae bacterium]
MSASLRPVPRDVIALLDGRTNPLVQLMRHMRTWIAARDAAVHLQGLTDHDLADIGITRSEIGPFVSGRLRRD